MRHNLITGHNDAKVDIDIGLQTLAECGYDDTHTVMVITYALQRWARGEKQQAQSMAIDPTSYGIDLISWLQVISAATEPSKYS